MGRKSNDDKMTIGIAFDTSNLIPELEKTLKKAVSNTDIASAVGDEYIKSMQEAEEQLKKLEARAEKIIRNNEGKSTAQIDKELGDLKREFLDLTKTVKALQTAFNQISDGDFSDTANGIGKVRAEVERLQASANKVKQTLGNLGKLTFIKDSKSLRKQRDQLQDLVDAGKDATNAKKRNESLYDKLYKEDETRSNSQNKSKSYEHYKLNQEEYNAVIEDFEGLFERYYNLKDKIEKGPEGLDLEYLFESSDAFSKYFEKLSNSSREAVVELISVMKDINEVQGLLGRTNFDDLFNEQAKGISKNFTDTDLQDSLNYYDNAEEVLLEKKIAIENEIEELSKTVAGSSALLNFNNGKIQIPVRLEETASSLIPDVHKIISGLTKYAKENPVKIAVEVNTKDIDDAEVVEAAKKKIQKDTKAATSSPNGPNLNDIVKRLDAIGGLLGQIQASIKEIDVSKFANITSATVQMDDGLTSAVTSLAKMIEELKQAGSVGTEVGKQWTTVVNSVNQMFDKTGKFKTSGMDALKTDFVKQFKEYQKIGGTFDLSHLKEDIPTINTNQIKSLQGALDNPKYNKGISEGAEQAAKSLNDVYNLLSEIKVVLDSITKKAATIDISNLSGAKDLLSNLKITGEAVDLTQVITALSALEQNLSNIISLLSFTTKDGKTTSYLASSSKLLSQINGTLNSIAKLDGLKDNLKNVFDTKVLEAFSGKLDTILGQLKEVKAKEGSSSDTSKKKSTSKGKGKSKKKGEAEEEGIDVTAAANHQLSEIYKLIAKRKAAEKELQDVAQKVSLKSAKKHGQLANEKGYVEAELATSEEYKRAGQKLAEAMAAEDDMIEDFYELVEGTETADQLVGRLRNMQARFNENGEEYAADSAAKWVDKAKDEFEKQTNKAEDLKTYVLKTRQVFDEIDSSLDLSQTGSQNINEAGLQKIQEYETLKEKLKELFSDFANFDSFDLKGQSNFIAEVKNTFSEFIKCSNDLRKNLTKKYTEKTEIELLTERLIEAFAKARKAEETAIKIGSEKSPEALFGDQKYIDANKDADEYLDEVQAIYNRAKELAKNVNSLTSEQGTKRQLEDFFRIYKSEEQAHYTRINSVEDNAQYRQELAERIEQLKTLKDLTSKTEDLSLNGVKLSNASTYANGTKTDSFGPMTDEGQTKVSNLVGLYKSFRDTIANVLALMNDPTWKAMGLEGQQKIINGVVIQYKDLLDVLTSVKSNWSDYEKETEVEIAGKDAVSNLAKYYELLERVSAIRARYGNDETELTKNTDYQRVTVEMQQYLEAYEKAKQRLEQLTTFAGIDKSLGSVTDARQYLKDLADFAIQKSAEINDTLVRGVNSGVQQLNEDLVKTNNLFGSIATAKVDYNLNDAGNNLYNIIFQEVTNLQKNIGNVDWDKLTPDEALNRINLYKQMLEGINEEIKELSGGLKNYKYTIPADALSIGGQTATGIKDKESFQATVNSFLSTQNVISGQFQNVNGVEQWFGTIKDGEGVLRETTLTMDQLTGYIHQNAQVVTQSTGVWKGMLSGVSQSAKSLAQVAVTFASLGTVTSSVTQTIWNSIGQGKEALLNYDKALTSIKYTMDLTENEFEQLGQSSIKMAEDLKMSIDDALTISQIYANMNTTAEEILTIGKPTAILANLTGVSADTAANQIQSVMQQFELAEDQAMHIVDVYDMVSANISMDYSKGIESISGGVSAAGQVAADAGVSFEQLSAIIAKTAERTRSEGSEIGQSLKTIISRISKASKLSAADEVDNDTLSKASAALADIGIKVYEADGEFRELDVILGELAEKWDSLSDAQRANISYEVAATRPSLSFAPLYRNVYISTHLTAGNTLEPYTTIAEKSRYECSTT